MQVTLDPKPKELHKETDPEGQKNETEKKESNSIPVVPTSKADYATDLFDFLPTNNFRENDTIMISANTKAAHVDTRRAIQCRFFTLMPA